MDNYELPEKYNDSHHVLDCVQGLKSIIFDKVNSKQLKAPIKITYKDLMEKTESENPISSCVTRILYMLEKKIYDLKPHLWVHDGLYYFKKDFENINTSELSCGRDINLKIKPVNCNEDFRNALLQSAAENTDTFQKSSKGIDFLDTTICAGSVYAHLLQNVFLDFDDLVSYYKKECNRVTVAIAGPTTEFRDKQSDGSLGPPYTHKDKNTLCTYIGVTLGDDGKYSPRRY
eukprot:Pgem_evm2s19532